MLFDGELDRLRPQPGAVPLVPQVHQLTERASAIVVARRQAFALLACTMAGAAAAHFWMLRDGAIGWVPAVLCVGLLGIGWLTHKMSS